MPATHCHWHARRFIVYNILGDCLGINSTGGPLGFRVKFFFVTWYNLLVPGSITCPLLPGVPAKRHPLQSLAGPRQLLSARGWGGAAGGGSLIIHSR